MTINWFVAGVAALQVGAAVWAAKGGDWQMALCNAALAVANAVFATMAKA